ncbi:hypothetical protein [Blastopirellula marina]|uniref:TIGR02646 family protein n=1 Tax=Blastopirellula marina TaxID=124 RepID=A0A2S8F9V4_9BACT|nr:hypothetical protein [Blastopirellula marina]PQO28929.1 hypothetical protein C5Y98_24525 [Blastopirellula marina]PTL42202.1 hypothetical protein C5Y97_24540 [Blastopirellula marina]
MIRIDVSRDNLRDLIENHKAGWIADAQSKTDDLEGDPTLEVKSIWSPIKQVFTDIQYSKCVFCEKKMEDQPIEQDVEHFRPKNNVRRWIVSTTLANDEGVVISQPNSGSEPGYRLLAYNYLNYAAACKTCNSTRKRDHFPIAASPRKSGSKNPATMKSEKAFLIYPISDLDDDPEDLIEFHGLSPQAKKKSGFGRQRALVTIEFFQLDDERTFLYSRRAQLIYFLFNALQMADNGNAQQQADGQKMVDHFTSAESEHTNCLRSFARLYSSDFPAAQSIAQNSLSLWATGSP